MNVAEQTPVKGHGSANVTGANGAAMAALVIHDAEAKAKAELGQEKPMKMRLKELEKLDGDSLIAFRLALREKQESIKAKADKAKLTLEQYREADSVSNSVYTTMSLWVKLARAVSAGFKHDPKASWAQISRLATAHLDTAKQAADQKKLVDERIKIEADTGMDPEVKRVELDRINLAMEGKIIKVGPTKRAGRPAKDFTVALAEFFNNRPLQDLETAHKWLGDTIARLRTEHAAPTASPAEVEKVAAGVGVPDKVEAPTTAPKAKKGKKAQEPALV